MGKSKVFNNYTLLKVVEECDEKTAIEMVSAPNLDGRELSEMLQCHISGTIRDVDTNEPLKLSNKVFLAGLRNRMMMLNGENNE